jgi:AcrR family transcriptional regulator
VDKAQEAAPPGRRTALSRIERKAATRAALIDAGERLIRKKGFSVSVEEIATEAGFTKGAVYSNFTGRTELFERICERVIPGLQVEHDTTLPSLAEALMDTAQQEIQAVERDAEQIVLQLDAAVQMLRDPELRASLLGDPRPGTTGDELPWPLPLPAAQWNVAVNAVALGLMVQRLLFGRREVPDELFVWLNRRLADD